MKQQSAAVAAANLNGRRSVVLLYSCRIVGTPEGFTVQLTFFVLNHRVVCVLSGSRRVACAEVVTLWNILHGTQQGTHRYYTNHAAFTGGGEQLSNCAHSFSSPPSADGVSRSQEADAEMQQTSQ